MLYSFREVGGVVGVVGSVIESLICVQCKQLNMGQYFSAEKLMVLVEGVHRVQLQLEQKIVFF